ncbi:MAG TPA: CAP domain-containing protein [Polyangiales bacterium]|nr:CAP domain-containing protein [Polyangiales bacterium]
MPGLAGSPAIPPGPPAGVAGASGPLMPTAGAGSMMTGGAAGSGTPAPGGDICGRWTADRTNLTEAAWNGDAASCAAGDMTPEARATAYRLHTLYRFMAGLEPVPMTDENNRKAQDCALLMTANGSITHTPPSTWKCYTMEGAATANASSLSGGGAISSVDGYMVDPGNPTTLGHRRWVLSSMLAGVGFGSSGKFSCQYQPATRPKTGGKPWIAWPPPGQIPIQAFGTSFSSMDKTGWSLQSDSVDLKSAQVSITAGGMDLPVTVTQLGSGYGSTYAISIIPMGWKATAGTTYSVKVTGASMPISYEVSVVDCR